MAKLSPKAEKFLEGKHFGKIATLMKDGSPHVTPIWYMLEDGKIVINTTVDRVKYYNILRDPRVGFLVDDGYPYVLIRGKARIATERDAKADIEALAVRYMGEAAGKKAARDHYWKDRRISVEIVPEKLVSEL